jgi:hypothetical protein
MIEEVGAPDAMEVPWQEEQTVSSSSGESPSSGHVRAMDINCELIFRGEPQQWARESYGYA